MGVKISSPEEISWQKIWEKKGALSQAFASEQEKIKALMSVGAWDTMLGGVEVGMIRGVANKVRDLIDAEPEDRVLDIGCGSGIIYYAMENRPKHLVGVDYSASSIQLAKAFVEGDFYCCPADEFPYEEGLYDGIFSIGVIMYFDDLTYTLKVLERMVKALKPGGKALLLDNPDLAKKEERENLRRGSMSAQAYKEKYLDLGLTHLYIAKEWFIEHLERMGCEVEEIAFFGDDYGYKEVNYDLLVRKKD